MPDIKNNTTEINHNEMPITTLLKLIPEFDTSKSDQVYRFVRSCDAAFDLASDNQKVILLTYALNGVTGPLSSDIHIKTHSSWQELKRFLISKFSQTKTLGHLNLELQSMFQKPNESVTEYFIRVDLCRNKILEKLTTEIRDSSLEGRKITTEETALNVFINGLSSDIGVMLRTKNFQNLSDAGNFAVQEDKIRNMNQARQNLFRGYTPAKPSAYNTNIQQRQLRPNIQNTNGTSSRTFAPSQLTCNYCKKQGHLIQDCRKRIFNNNKQKYQQPTTSERRVNHLNFPAAVEADNSSATASPHCSDVQTQIQDLIQW